MTPSFDLRRPLFAAYAFVNQRGWLHSPWMKVAFREAYFLYKKYYEDPFWRLVTVRPDLFREGHVLDVGANIGYTALCFARAVDPGCFVYAFEPEAVNFRELMKTAARSSTKDRIKPVKKAVGEKHGSVELWINDEHHADHRVVTRAYEDTGRDLRKRERVEVVAIDEFVRDEGIAERISFVKMDVQGYELLVCQGMTDTLAANPAMKVAVEYSPEHLLELGFEPERLLDFFRERDFQAYVLNRHRTGPVMRAWDWRAMDPEGYMDIVFSRRRLL